MKLQALNKQVSSEDREWQDRAQYLTLNSLYDIRAVAGRWAATIGSLTGVLSLVALVAGPRAVDQVPLAWRIAIGALVLVAIISAGCAAWTASDAAQGRILTTLSTYARIRESFREEEERARELLRRSKILVVIAMAALILAIGISWFVPTRPPQVVIVRQNGNVSCIPLAGGLALFLRIDSSATIAVAPRCARH